MKRARRRSETGARPSGVGRLLQERLDLTKTAELTGGTFRADLHDVVANDEHAVAIYVGRAEREGQTFENRNVLVQHIRSGKLVEMWLLSDDQYAADEFFS